MCNEINEVCRMCQAEADIKSLAVIGLGNVERLNTLETAYQLQKQANEKLVTTILKLDSRINKLEEFKYGIIKTYIKNKQ